MIQISRRLVGHTVNIIAWLTRPAQIQRNEQERKLLANELKSLRIYDYKGCPKSLKLRQALHRLNLDIEYCDIRVCQVHRDNLLAQFGRLHAPCLRIEEGQSVRWLDESEQIIRYLNQRFPSSPAQSLPA